MTEPSRWQEQVDYIAETMRQVSLHTEPHEMVAAYNRRMRGTLAGTRFLSLSRRGVEPPKFVIARDSAWASQPNPWTERHALPVIEGGLLGDLVYGNQVRLLEGFELADDDPMADRLRGLRSLLAIPVYDGGEALNMVVFLREATNSFDAEEIPGWVWQANLFGRATHNLVLSRQLEAAYEALDREMRVIADIQRSLLPPELPPIPTLDLACYYQPAKRAGGDYYDFFPLPDGTWGILIADVSGHGSPAAVLMAITRTLAHLRANEPATPGALLDFLNRQLAARTRQTQGDFVTAFAGVYHPESCMLHHANAGHPAPRLKRCSDGSMFSLEGAGGPPLGVLTEAVYPDTSHELTAGDQIIFYTDGITEAFNARNEMFGLERLDQTLHDCSIDAQGLIDAVLEEVATFTAGREADDDRTLLVARVTSA